jgi:competence protein ComGC
MVVQSDIARHFGRSRPRSCREPRWSEVVYSRGWGYFGRCQLWFTCAVAVIALTLSLQTTAFGTQVVYSLDNRPRAPIAGDVTAPGIGNGAEDPFGLLPLVPSPTLIGPSPSLNTFSGPPLNRQLSDADILVPGGVGVNGPAVNTQRPFDTNYINEISSNRAPAHGQRLVLAFSVDRASMGHENSWVRNQFVRNQQPGDIFITDRDFPAPSSFVGTLFGAGWQGYLPSAGTGNSNVLLINQSTLKLTAGMGVGNFISSTGFAPPITPGSHDNVDAFDMAPLDTSGDRKSDKRVYFTVNPDEPTLHPANYLSAADIYQTPPGSIVPTIFAQATTMGLDAAGWNMDDIDGLEVFDRGTIGSLDPGLDYALFSLAPGSRSLSPFSIRTAADIFFTDFQNSFATYARDSDLGLSGTVAPAELGGPGSGADLEPTGNDNADALGSYPLGDMDWSGNLAMADVDDFVQGMTRPSDYRDVNLDHKGQPASRLGDFSVPKDGLDFDDVGPFRTAIQLALSQPPSQSVPEPGVVSLVTLALGMLTGRRRCLPPRRRSTHRRVQIAGRAAYSIVELLVVITIISVLLALLMPAIQASRESARSAQCCNHLKQLLLANQSYHSSHNQFPPGSTLAPREDQLGNSWLVFCLAYLEEQEVADRILKRGESIAPPIPLFFCPSDSIVTGGANQLHVTSYCGSGGAGRDPKFVIKLEPSASVAFCGDVYTDGILFPLSQVSAKSITDGLSHTLAIGERTYFKHIWADGAYWIGSAAQRLCTESSKNVRWPINSPAATSGYYVYDGSVPQSLRKLPMNELYFGSRHPGGAWFAFAGGNVQFIANDIAFSVYQDLATRNGGEVLGADGAP